MLEQHDGVVGVMDAALQLHGYPAGVGGATPTRHETHKAQVARGSNATREFEEQGRHAAPKIP